MQNQVKTKLYQLCMGELTAVASFAFVWVLYLQLFEWTEPYLTSFSSLFAFGLLEFILLQGSYYWYVKWRQLQQGSYNYLPVRQLRLFAFFHKLNILLIGIGFFIMIHQFKEAAVGAYWCLFVYGFAMIEYINYYHIRLSYQTKEELKRFLRQKKLRKSKLAAELQAYKGLR
ncbi:MAG TPA: hypothetical protein VE710_01500 [Candidatus Bathyarchaeia archaeon]|nr:hypothetical protein [Candidatus Bathyarchaeia archaeon]